MSAVRGDGLFQHRAQPESNLTPDKETASWDLQVKFPSIADWEGCQGTTPSFPPSSPIQCHCAGCSLLLTAAVVAARSSTELCAELRSSVCSVALSCQLFLADCWVIRHCCSCVAQPYSTDLRVTVLSQRRKKKKTSPDMCTACLNVSRALLGFLHRR